MKISDLSPEEQEQLRAKWRDAQQKTRNKKRQDPEEAQWIRKTNEEGLKRRQELGYCFLGEDRPGHDAETIESALAVCREFARALGISDVGENESLLEFERRTFDAWVNYDKFCGRNDCQPSGGGAPFLNRKTQQLSPGWGKGYWLEHCGGFDNSWAPLSGGKQPIDVSTLPKLRPVPEIPKPKPEPKPVEASPAPTSAEVLAHGRVQLLNQLRTYDPTLPPDARRYLDGF